MNPERSLPAWTGDAVADWGVASVFALVYLGMFLGGLPRLKLDRSGVALLGAIAMIALTGMPIREAAEAIDLPTVVLLFAFMVVSAQMRLGGFYTAVTQRVAGFSMSRRSLLAALILVAGGLSAVFSNDIVCLAMTPVVARLCLRRGLDPLPFLIGLACAANIGSAATLIGNPQNMLIGSVLQLSFGTYVLHALPPVAISLAGLWAWLAFAPDGQAGRRAPIQSPEQDVSGEQVPLFDPWQTTKGLTVALGLMGVFLLTDWPRDVAALVGAGVLLLSRKLHSSRVMGLIDWPLLVLFMGLFVVNHAFERTGMAAGAVGWLRMHGVSPADPGPLLLLGAGLSNLVSNVPAVMLLLPHLEADPVRAGTALALVSTFAGNLLLVGSIANLIVADMARAEGIVLGWKRHLRTGLPVTVLSMLVLWFWLP